MNKLVKAKRYNTDTATSICKTEQEELFLKRTGEYFLVDWGCEKITPLTQERAERWVETNCPEAFEQIFRENSKRTRLTVYLSGQMADELKMAAVERRITLSELVERLVENFLR